MANKADANLMLPMLIQGNIGIIKQLVQKSGGTFKYSYGNVAAIIIPVNALPAFSASAGVTRMEGAPPHNRPLDDSSNAKNHITEVLNGSCLPQAYNGKGIVIGFIDSGIELKHADFSDSSGTRVKFLWDQNLGTGPYTPAGFGYGQAWNKKQIDVLMTLPLQEPDSAHCLEFGHGSNVAGIACGNARCNGQEIGGAPKSDIIMVAFNFNVQTTFMLTDAVKYIYDCADSLGEPCVINASLGDYGGSHDDSDLQGIMIDNIIAAKQPGRVFVAAAGNEGIPYHVHDSLRKGDTTFTWFMYDANIDLPNPGYADIPIFANETDFNSVKFRIRCDKVQTGSYSERDTMTVFYSIKDFMGSKTVNVFNNNGQRLGVIKSLGTTYSKGSYSLEFKITPDSTSYYWGFEATDTGTTYGRYDIWDLGSINGVVDSNGLAINTTTFPKFKKYKLPDTLMTVCGSFQCSPHVITVQTYFDRLTYKDCTGAIQKNGNPKDVPGAFVWTTSRGPARNFHVMKPDVAAAGNFNLSATPICYSVGCNSGVDSLGCHNPDGGTSMASPIVASAAALYLERYPNATDSNVKRCILATAYTDQFTQTTSQSKPSYNWGYGKLHTCHALSQCGPTDVPMIAGNTNPFKLSAYPNPYTNTTIINYDFSGIKEFSKANIVVFDMMGKVVKTIDLKGNQGNVTMDRAKMSAGVYFYSLMVDGSRLKTEKLVVQ